MVIQPHTTLLSVPDESSPGLVFQVITEIEEFRPELLNCTQPIIFDNSRKEQQHLALLHLRNCNTFPFYLLPTVSTNNDVSADTTLEQYQNNTGLFEVKFQSIFKRISELRKNQTHPNLERKLLEFLYSRESNIEPAPDRTMKNGISYGIWDAFLTDRPLSQVFEVIQGLNSKAFTKGTARFRIPYCPSCLHGYLLQEESCPNCSSIEFEQQGMIHHFPCAHIDSEVRYQTEAGLQCPKCSKKLKALGVDYDRPGLVNTCTSCNHRFPQPETHILCGNCGRKSAPQDVPAQYHFSHRLSDWGKRFLFSETKELDSYRIKACALQDRAPLRYSQLVERLQYELERDPIASGSLAWINFEANISSIDAHQSLISELGHKAQICLCAPTQYLILMPQLSVHDLNNKLLQIKQVADRWNSEHKSLRTCEFASIQLAGANDAEALIRELVVLPHQNE